MDIVAIVLEALLGLAFLMAGITKLMGQKMHVDNFNRWKLPQWFRLVTGAVEVVGGAAMVAGIWVEGLPVYAGIWLGLTMLGGIIVHIRIKDSFKDSGAAIFLLVLSVVVVLLQ